MSSPLLDLVVPPGHSTAEVVGQRPANPSGTILVGLMIMSFSTVGALTIPYGIAIAAGALLWWFAGMQRL